MDILYQIFIYPLEMVMQWVLSVSYKITRHYGVSLFLLSLIVNLVLLPFFHIAEKWQEAEREAQRRLRPKLQEFRQAFSGEERFMMIRTLYRQHGYHPIYALRTSLGFLIQVPFFIAAYHFLSHYHSFEGASFFIFENLNKPDALLWGINLLPFVMTGINFLSAVVYAQRLNMNEKIQLWSISLLFLILLYSSPAALLIYWTFNNVFSLLKNLAYAQYPAIRRIRVGQAGPIVSRYPNHGASRSGVGSMPFWIGKEPSRQIKRIFQSPYVLALLVGIYPVLFFVSNNWFLFEASEGLFILGLFSLLIFLVLSVYYAALSWSIGNLFPACSQRMIQRLFVPISFFVLAFQLRHHLLPVVDNRHDFLLALLIFIALIFSWYIPRIQLFRVNMVLFVMCLAPLGNGLYAITTAEENKLLGGTLGYEAQQKIYDHVTFSTRPNVYYIVPDGYPNRDALRKLFDIDNSDFYQHLESLDFLTHHAALSNYRSSPESVSSTFGMGHHYYGGNIGNFEMLNSKRFIASDQNPVVQIFKNNGYKVHFLHSNNYLLRRGCFVDSCYPQVSLSWWHDFVDVLLPSQLMSITEIKRVIAKFPMLVNGRKGGVSNSSQSGSISMGRILTQIENISKQNTPSFTYIHLLSSPGHSHYLKQTHKDLEFFRKEFTHRISKANNEVIRIIHGILDRDPNAFIVINADHGAFGYGYKDFAVSQSLEEGVSEYLIGLDQLGVLLSIRWPDGSPKFVQEIRTNVNLFRYLFSYLSDNDIILASKVPDHGFISKGRGKEKLVIKVVHAGEVLDQMIEMESVE